MLYFESGDSSKSVLRLPKATMIHARRSSIVAPIRKSYQNPTGLFVQFYLQYIQCTSNPHLSGNPFLGIAQLRKLDLLFLLKARFAFYALRDVLYFHDGRNRAFALQCPGIISSSCDEIVCNIGL